MSERYDIIQKLLGYPDRRAAEDIQAENERWRKQYQEAVERVNRMTDTEISVAAIRRALTNGGPYAE